MLSGAARRFAALPTTVKLLLILSAALLPIGLALVWVAGNNIREANAALHARTQDDSREAVRGIESLVARNALALRIAANGALAQGPDDACARAQRSLALSPAPTRGNSFPISGPAWSRWNRQRETRCGGRAPWRPRALA